MVDWYTKAVLTVIAGALVTLAVNQIVQPAQSQVGPCGTRDNPCSVTTVCRWVLGTTPCDSYVKDNNK